MLESVGSLTGGPWIYAVVALSVLLDVFLPVLPSGVLIITAATAAAAARGGGRAGDARGAVHPGADPLGGHGLGTGRPGRVPHRLARRRTSRPRDRPLRRLTSAQERLGGALARSSGGILVVIARFAPAGRSIVSFAAGTAHRRVREFLPWSALAGVAWAGYSVALGYFGGQWLGASWLATGVSLLALCAAGSGAAFLMRRPAAERVS